MDNDKLPELIRGNVKVEWVNLGEGWSGDYDEDDPDDQNLLRFDVSKRGPDGEWEEVPDASYCTRMPADTDTHILENALLHIMDTIYDDVSNHGKAKRLCESLSWISPKTFP